MRLLIISVIILMLGFSSCEKPQYYSFIPEIKHVSTEIKHKVDVLGNTTLLAEVRFSFIDGNGDLGLDQGDTLGDFAPGKEHYYNLKFQFHEKNQGEFIINDNIQPLYRFQNISKVQTTNKVIKGEMLIEIDFLETLSYADTSKLTFFIYDRALNKSNVVETPELFLNE